LPLEDIEVSKDVISSKVSAKNLAVIRDVMSKREVDSGKRSKVEFVYSQSSLNVLKEIKMELNEIKQSCKENVQDRTVSIEERVKSIVNSYSAKQKYEELLQPQRMLMIPIHLKQVLRLAGALDAVINYFKARGKAQVYDELRKSIESTYHMNFSIPLLEKLLEVVPEFYSHEWVHLEGRRNFSLIIDIPDTFPQILDLLNNEGEIERIEELLKNSKKGMNVPMDTNLMEMRASIVRLRIINITNEHHKEFLRFINEESYNPFKHKTWHHQFKVHDVDIQGKKLKGKPEMRRSLGVSEFIKKNDIKDQLVRAALEEVAKSNEQLNQSADSSLKGVLSDSLIMKIQAKENAIRRSHKLLDKSAAENKARLDQSRLLNRCSAIMTIFITNGGKAMLMEELIKRLQNEEDLSSMELLRKDVETLIDQVPTWIKKVYTDRGVFIKIDRKVNMNVVKEVIERNKH